MLLTGKELLEAADRSGYAVGAFNVHTMEMLSPVIEAAEELRAPVILQFTAGSLEHIGADMIGSAVVHKARMAKVPVAIHLDHGASFELAVVAVRNGFTSVMIDASRFPLGENIALTQRVVAVAHAAGVSVEAELGRVGGAEENVTVDEREATLTLPEEAERFAADTGVDYLAVAFGTAHGFYKGEPRLDLERLEEIDRRVAVPLVMHGGSGVPAPLVREAIRRGVRKVNVATELKDAWTTSLKSVIQQNPSEIDPRKLLSPAREAVKNIVREKIQLCGSAGRA